MLGELPTDYYHVVHYTTAVPASLQQWPVFLRDDVQTANLLITAWPGCTNLKSMDQKQKLIPDNKLNTTFYKDIGPLGHTKPNIM